jgi:hypothetical protein
MSLSTKLDEQPLVTVGNAYLLPRILCARLLGRLEGNLAA